MWWASVIFLILFSVLFTKFYNFFPLFFTLVSQYNVAIPLVLILNIGDWDSTRRLINIYGAGIEQNPFAKKYFAKHGYGLRVAFYKLLFGSCTCAAIVFIVAPPLRMAVITTFTIVVGLSYLEICLASKKR